MILVILIPIFYFLIYPIFSIGANSFSIYRSTTNFSENLSDFNNETISNELVSLNRNMRNINKGFETFKIHRVSESSDMDNLDYNGIYMLED